MRRAADLTDGERKVCEIFSKAGYMVYYNGKYYPTKAGKKFAKLTKKLGGIEKVLEAYD